VTPEPGGGLWAGWPEDLETPGKPSEEAAEAVRETVLDINQLAGASFIAKTLGRCKRRC